MSERTFRAVVAAVLVGALVLAAIALAATLSSRPAEPAPSSSAVVQPTTGPRTPTPTPGSPGPVFETPGVVGVGLVARGASSAATLSIEFVEPSAGAIPNAPGTLRVTLADADGQATITFEGTPTVRAPGSLGATAMLETPTVLLIEIEASDPANIESISVTGLAIRAAPTAALGRVQASVGGLSGSLAGGPATAQLASPGTVVDRP